jgi:hypothetical protein
VHVGVEEAVAEHLGEEDLHARAGEALQVDSAWALRRHTWKRSRCPLK